MRTKTDNRRTARAAIFEHNGLWLVRERSGQWGLPGGGVEPGETLAEAAIRELEEETGLEGEAKDLICFIPQCEQRGEQHIFEVVMTGGEVRLPASREILDAGHFAASSILEMDRQGLIRRREWMAPTLSYFALNSVSQAEIAVPQSA